MLAAATEQGPAAMTIQSIDLKLLRPTQMAVGLRLVKHKIKGLRRLDRKPQELVDFILENPIRVVLGPKRRAYVIDHHHLGLALIREGFRTAPVVLEQDFSSLAAADFRATMEKRQWLHPFDGRGEAHSADDIPADLMDLEDDPYRSLAGFVRYGGGFVKTDLPYMEFQWADYFRTRVKRRLVVEDLARATKKADALAHLPEASGLPGYVPLEPAGHSARMADADD
jgi:hypothetical protein